MGRHILFKCPRLGTNVQHWLPETSPEDEPNSYVSVVCLACTRLHFIHKKTGKLSVRTDPATGRVRARDTGPRFVFTFVLFPRNGFRRSA